MDEIASPFLNLPVELQKEVVDYLSQYSDLKALRLVSKQASEIVTPRLYYKVDLRNNEKYYDRRILQRINSPFIQPENLRFVRILKTRYFGSEETQLVDRLLPVLRQDSLMEFRFLKISTKCLPTPLQMQFMWTHQENIQNVKLYSHMVPVLDELLKEHQPSRSSLLKSFNKLVISHRAHDCVLNIQSKTSWLLQNLDLGVLHKLRIDGINVYDFILSTRKRKISTEFTDSTTSLSVPIKRKYKNWFHPPIWPARHTNYSPRGILKHLQSRYPDTNLYDSLVPSTVYDWIDHTSIKRGWNEKTGKLIEDGKCLISCQHYKSILDGQLELIAHIKETLLDIRSVSLTINASLGILALGLTERSSTHNLAGSSLINQPSSSFLGPSTPSSIKAIHV